MCKPYMAEEEWLVGGLSLSRALNVAMIEPYVQHLLSLGVKHVFGKLCG